MIEAVLNLFGPLAYPEVVRASRRGGLILVRCLAAVGGALGLLTALALGRMLAVIIPGHSLDDDVRTAIVWIAGGLIAFMLVVAPATLAGSLAGERRRGSIALLLATPASARDIVLGRWAGRLVPLGLVAASVLPFLVGLLALGSVAVPAALMIWVLPVAVGVGSSGLALAVSAVSRRGRDALLVIYLLDIVGLVATGALGGSGVPAVVGDVLNPFAALAPLVDDGRIGPSVAAALGWLALGAVGLTVASGRLRPSCLRDGSGSTRLARRGRWRRVPPIGDRPMLWKELHIDRAGSLGRVGRVLGGALALALAGGSLALGATAALAGAGFGPVAADDGAAAAAQPWATRLLATWYGWSTVPIGFLIQWGIGLRSAASVASERERGTWDGLLTSPLTAREIIGGKLAGAWHAVRLLVAAAVVAWTICWACGGMTTYRYALTLAETAVWGTLMAALGLAMSLRRATATRAMAATMGGWLVIFAATKFLATMGAAVVLGVIAGLLGSSAPAGRFLAWLPWFAPAVDWGSLGIAAGLAALLLLDIVARFDRLAGRLADGATAAAIDDLIHGRPLPPVRLGPTSKSTRSAVRVTIEAHPTTIDPRPGAS